MTDTSEELSKRTEEFIETAEKGSSKEVDKKLLELLEKGIDPDYIRYYDGWQRMDDGYRWGNAYHLLTFVLDHCSLDVMKKVFEKYPGIINQVGTTTRSTYRGYSDAYWLRGLNDGNGEDPHVKNSEIAFFLIDKLPDYHTRCLKNAFAKLSFDDCMKLLENPDVSEDKKSVLLKTKEFEVDTPKTLLSLRPYLKDIQNITLDLKELSNQEVLAFLADKESIKSLRFRNFPTDKKEQEPLVQRLTDMLCERVFVVGKDGYEDDKIRLQKLIDNERQKRVERENKGKADWKVAFLKKCAVKDFKSALWILEKQGILSTRTPTSKSSFGREFDLSPLGWGNNSLEVHNDLIAVDIKGMGKETFAIGQIYEDRKWRSTVDYHSGIGWWWSGEIAIVNLDKGVGATATTNQICVRHPEDVSRDIFGEIPREDFVSVSGTRAGIHLGSYAWAGVEIPTAESNHSRLKEASQPKAAKKTTKTIRRKESPVNE